MSEKFGKLPIGPRSRPHESADYLNHAFETSDIAEICKAIGVVTHRACRKSNPKILVVQPAQDRAAKNGPG
jgi:hypothetical protein